MNTPATTPLFTDLDAKESSTVQGGHYYGCYRSYQRPVSYYPSYYGGYGYGYNYRRPVRSINVVIPIGRRYY